MVILQHRRKYMVSRRPKGATVPISECVVTLERDSVAYTGSACTVGVSVTWEGATLAVNTDYTLSWANNVNVGPATVTVTGMGQFAGSVTKTFYIVPAGSPWSGVDLSAMSTTPVLSVALQTPGGATNIPAQQMNVNRDYPGHVFISTGSSGGVYYDWSLGGENYDLSLAETSPYKTKNGFTSEARSCTVDDGGDRMFFSDNWSASAGNYLFYATLSTSYDISTGTYQGSVGREFPVRPRFMLFSPDGKKFFYKGNGADTVACVNLGTPFRFSSFISEESFNLGVTNTYGMHVSNDGKNVLLGIMESSRPKLAMLSLSTPFDFSTSSVASVSPALVDYESYPQGVLMARNGSRVLVWLSADNKIYEYSLA